MCSAQSGPLPNRSHMAPSSSVAAVATLALALVLALAPTTHASWITGTDFPFENCVQRQANSPYSAVFHSYKENPSKKTSQFCLKLNVAETCVRASYRCCNTHINKIKFFPAPECKSSLSSAVINGTVTTAVYWELHDDNWIVKVTPLMKWLSDPAAAKDQIVCFNLRMPCWTMEQFAFDHEVLEYSLYDKKVDDYECCPSGQVEVPIPSGPPVPPAPDMPPAPDSPPEPSAPPKAATKTTTVKPASPKPSAVPSPVPSPDPSPAPDVLETKKSPKKSKKDKKKGKNGRRYKL